MFYDARDINDDCVKSSGQVVEGIELENSRRLYGGLFVLQTLLRPNYAVYLMVGDALIVDGVAFVIWYN